MEIEITSKDHFIKVMEEEILVGLVCCNACVIDLLRLKNTLMAIHFMEEEKEFKRGKENWIITNIEIDYEVQDFYMTIKEVKCSH